ncbi:hypothetical protein R2F61_00180 [Mollicutes bacterium LVI A0078]|nr:hypothetical protein RZE84_00180 [Mollicutes bacterium LVI A0075]WOO90997.1 hypothetical protein R2F61_00180 [Mollicutes bacterium LVI A0078]
MERICGMDVKVNEQEAKYYKKVFKYSGFIPLITFFLLASMAVSSLLPINYMMGVIVIIFTIYFLYIIRIDKVGTKQHLYAGIILVGAYLFYGASSYNVTLAMILGFVVFITFINGRELQTKAIHKKVTNKR